ncbi:glycosyl transferase, partial [Aquimarina sp. BL5]
MKILIVNTLYYPHKIGGAEISVQSIAEGLQKKGIEVAVLTLGERNEDLVSNNVPIYRLTLENTFWPFDQIERSKIDKLKWHISDVYNSKYNKRIHEIINVFNPTIIHTNNLTGFSVAIWDVAKERGIKVVHTLRDYYLQCPKTNKFKKGSACSTQCLECKLLSKKKKNVSQKIDIVTGISNSILQSHIDQGYFKNALK